MRVTLGIALCTLAGGAFAQSGDLALSRSAMAAGLLELSQNSTLHFSLQGAEEVGSKRTVFQVETSLQSSQLEGRSIYLFEQNIFENGALAKRLVGDGVHLWAWDPRARTYSALRYGRFDGSPEATNVFFRGVSLRSRGPSSFVAQVLAQAFGAEATNPSTAATRWAPWTPMAQVSLAPNAVVATSPDGRTLLSYLFDPTREEQDLAPRLMGAEYNSQTTVAGASRTIFWQMAIFRELPPSANFTFAPPRDARPLAVSSTRE